MEGIGDHRVPVNIQPTMDHGKSSAMMGTQLVYPHAKEIQSVCKVTVGIGSRKDIPFVNRVVNTGRINLNLKVLEEI